MGKPGGRQNLTEYARFPIETILPLCGPASGPFTHVLPDGRTIVVKQRDMRSLRMQCFKQSTICATCGLKGRVLIMERCVGPGNYPHFNLYAYRGGNKDALVLMTQDHVTARCLGGKDELANLRTMCISCNNKKGKQEAREVRRRREQSDRQHSHNARQASNSNQGKI